MLFQLERNYFDDVGANSFRVCIMRHTSMRRIETGIGRMDFQHSCKEIKRLLLVERTHDDDMRFAAILRSLLPWFRRLGGYYISRQIDTTESIVSECTTAFLEKIAEQSMDNYLDGTGYNQAILSMSIRDALNAVFDHPVGELINETHEASMDDSYAMMMLPEQLTRVATSRIYGESRETALLRLKLTQKQYDQAMVRLREIML